MTCAYTFTDPAGKKLTITGKNAFKAYLANGGLQHLAPGRAAAFNQTDTPAFKRWFGDSKAEAPKASARSDTIAQRTGRLNTDGLRKAVAKGALGPVVSAMIDNNIIILHDTTATLPDAKASKTRGVQAITTADGKIHLVAANLTAENAQPVMWHEMFHKGGERLIGTKEWGNLMGRGAALYRQAEQSTGKSREFFDKARARVAAAKRQGAVKTGNEVEEFLAYAIEEYETAPASIRKWVDDVIGLIKAWFLKTYGKQLGALTPAQLSAIAKMALMDVAADRRGEMFGAMGTVFSATEQTNTPAFKRFFKQSKVVDEAGEPLMVYHGTMDDFDVFGEQDDVDFAKKLGLPYDGKFFFAKSPGAAGTYTNYVVPGANIIPAYLSIQNPLIVDAKGQRYDAGRNDTFGGSAGLTMDAVYQAIEKGNDGVIVRNVRDDVNGQGEPTDVFIAFNRTQIKSAIGNNGDFDPTNPDIRYSVTPERAETIIDEANAALKASKTSGNYIGSVAGDLGWYMRLFGHPRQVAAVHREFVPSYKTAISQQETRDKIISQFGDNFRSYHDLDQAGKENVNKVLELGRLTSQTYTAEELANGVGNPGEKSTVVMVDGKPQIAKEPMTALLTEVGEVVKLSEDEIAAYRDLRSMFDDALDRLRDQTLTEMGFEQFAGEKNAAKAIIATITDATSEDQAERLKNVAAFVGEIEQAKRSGYVPFARYGDYVVTVKEKIADVEYLDDVDGYKIARGLPDSFAPDMLEMGAEQTKEGWRITPNQIKDVNRLTEKTVYSEKVELPLTEKLLKERKDVKYTDIPSVGEAYNKAVNEWEAGNPNRKTYVFPVRERKTEKTLKLSDVMSLAEVSGLDNATMDRMRDAMSDAIKAKGFRRHFLHSDNVPGYTGDFERSMADYIIGMGGYLSRRQHMSAWDRAVEATKNKSTLNEFAMRYRDYVNDPQEELAMIRQIGFFSYIAGVAASAFANLTQVPLLTVSTLQQIAPLPLVLKEVVRAYKDVFAMMSDRSILYGVAAGVATGIATANPTLGFGVGSAVAIGKTAYDTSLDMFDMEKAPEDVREIIKEALDEGAFVPLETLDLMMTARQRNVGARKGVKVFNTVTQVSSILFTFAERVNRLVTFIAAARMADKRAVKENAKRVLTGDALAESQLLRNWGAKSLAEWAVDESQYRMGKANRPTTMRGVGAAILQFKGFMLQTFEAWYRMAALHGGKEGKLAAAASIAAMASLAGVWGLPGADDLRKLIEAVYKQITDKDLDLKTELRAWVARKSGSNAVAQIVNKGVAYPYGIDLTRVGMGSIVPDSPLAAAGIPFDMLIGRPKRAFEKGSTGDYLGAAGEFTPNFSKNWLIAISWATQGVRDKRGNMLLPPEDIEMSDWTKKVLGFQPSVVTDVRDYEYAQRRTETAVDALKRNYTNKIARLEYQLDTTSDPQKADEIQKRIDAIYDQIDEHNENAPEEHQIEISDRTLRQKIEREEEGVRATWGKERKAARDAAEDLRRVFGLSD